MRSSSPIRRRPSEAASKAGRLQPLQQPAELSAHRENAIRDEGVGLPLLAEGAGGAMTRNEDGVVTERPQTGRDRVEKILMIAHRKIRPTDRALEKNVADDGQPRRRVMKDDMARGVTWAMIDVEDELP